MRAKTCQQVMGDLPTVRTTPAAPFQFTSIDLFGPYLVRDDVRRRVKIKVWGVLFCCMVSRAIHIELASSLSTESFLLAYQRFTAFRGHPEKVWSDQGTNFVGAKPVLEELYSFLQGQNHKELAEYANEHGTCWAWQMVPADSPHRNGAAEAGVKIAKRALQKLGQSAVLTFQEFLTVLQLAANLANERPIDARLQSREDRIEYVSPNSLLLGRASQNGDFACFSFARYPYRRLQEIQVQVDGFWKAWSQLAGPNLFIRSKWHTAERNVSVGDIVWICDQNALRGQFRLGKVVDVFPDAKGKVRDVNVSVTSGSCAQIYCPSSTPPRTSRNSDPDSTLRRTILRRDVRRLVVLLPLEEQDIQN